MVRLADFLEAVEPHLKPLVIATLLEGIEILEKFPRMAKPSEDERYKTMRELFVAFGKAGYAALYEYYEEKISFSLPQFAIQERLGLSGMNRS
jgi:hypothetical protein